MRYQNVILNSGSVEPERDETEPFCTSFDSRHIRVIVAKAMCSVRYQEAKDLISLSVPAVLYDSVPKANTDSASRRDRSCVTISSSTLKHEPHLVRTLTMNNLKLSKC